MANFKEPMDSPVISPEGDVAPLAGKNVLVCDTTLRDGMHSVAHQFTTENVAEIARGLDESGINVIEVTHGDGEGGAF